MTNKVFSVVLLTILLFVAKCGGWKAVPANQAMYSRRFEEAYQDEDVAAQDKADDDLPRNSLHSIYKFGWCSPDSTKPQYLRKTVNMTLLKFVDFKTRYIYLLDTKHTQRFDYQCLMMKAYTPKKYQFRKSRLPIYYCQGIARYLVMNTIQKFEIHEFYMQQLMLIPINFIFDIYWAPPL